MKALLRNLLIVVAALLAAPVLAVQPDEVLSDPALESRAREISAELRCLVCQNQSIDDSEAELARDLRLLVRERLVEGDSNDEVFDYVVARYGEFVLLRPVLAPHTIVLWIAAPVLLLIGIITLFFAARRRKAMPAETTTLSEDEQKALDRLMKE